VPTTRLRFCLVLLNDQFSVDEMPDTLKSAVFGQIATAFICVAALIASSVTARPLPPNTREIRLNTKDGQKYAWIPAGRLTIEGAVSVPRENATRAVKINKGLWVGQTEITVQAYQLFVNDTGESMPPESQWNPGFKNNHMPIVNMTWDEARAFCAWAGGRLPSEVEWEYAARAGNATEPSDELAVIAWYGKNSGQSGPLEVGQKRANAWNLYDMFGNVWEWTTGRFPLTGKNDGPNLPPHPDRPFFAIRGGSWADPDRVIGASARGRAEAGHRSNSIGARCVLDSIR
jgi:formylglycine-generating enzyme required for sulfatase activity